MTASQAGALRRGFDRFGLRVDGAALDLATVFGGRPVVVEIGFGMGEATAAMAAAAPDTGILAVDVHAPGQGSLLNLLEQQELDNVRVADGDAVVLLRDMLPPASLTGVRIFFPDPWPKKRHHKRRLVQPEFVRLATSRLAPGGTLHCATDWEPYAEQMLQVLSEEAGLTNRHLTFAPRPPRTPAAFWRPETRFEQQGEARGYRVNDLLFERTAAAQ